MQTSLTLAVIFAVLMIPAIYYSANSKMPDTARGLNALIAVILWHGVIIASTVHITLSVLAATANG